MPLYYMSVVGAAGGNRTHDLMLTRQLLYQLSYTSMAYPEGLEPPTLALEVPCSIQLSYE